MRIPKSAHYHTYSTQDYFPRTTQVHLLIGLISLFYNYDAILKIKSQEMEETKHSYLFRRSIPPVLLLSIGCKGPYPTSWRLATLILPFRLFA